MSFYAVSKCPTCKTCFSGSHERSLKGILHVLFSLTEKSFATKFNGNTFNTLDVVCYDLTECDQCKEDVS
jgi:hypothetical protein